MKSFNFRLEESLHQDLKALAQAEGTSMAALCREALALYVERQKAELGMPQCPQVRHGAAWMPPTVEIDDEDGWGPQWCSVPQQARKRHRTPPATEPAELELDWQDFDSLFQPYHGPFSESAPSIPAQPDPRRYDPYLSFDTTLKPRQTFPRYPRTLLDELWA